ncbi:MAG: HPr kinase/phosphorylase [Betaproteobacteria bacterium]|nr:HPr kinase/phosphorylase [Betaproteobacteria bacterium]
MPQVSVARLYEDNRGKLGLTWLAGREGAESLVTREAADAAELAGHLNLIHPTRVQVVGAHEAKYLASLDQEAFPQFIAGLMAVRPAAIVLADGIPPLAPLIEAAEAACVAVLTSTAQSARIIYQLRRYLAKSLADSVSLHGVFMDVLGLGVLITGDSGVGKSELALELISRGNGLVADDVVEISRIAINTLEGRCPPMLKDFLEVRGLGVLNIRTIFGETAVRPKMTLKLIVNLQKPAPSGTSEAQRLPLHEIAEDIAGVTVRKIVIPVAPGRNLAVLLEAAVRNYILQLRGIHTTEEFIARHREELKK